MLVSENVTLALRRLHPVALTDTCTPSFPLEQIVKDKTVSQIMRRKSCFCIPPRVSSGIWLTRGWEGVSQRPLKLQVQCVCVWAGGVSGSNCQLQPAATHRLPTSPRWAPGQGFCSHDGQLEWKGHPVKETWLAARAPRGLPGAPSEQICRVCLCIDIGGEAETHTVCHREGGVSSGAGRSREQRIPRVLGERGGSLFRTFTKLY